MHFGHMKAHDESRHTHTYMFVAMYFLQIYTSLIFLHCSAILVTRLHLLPLAFPDLLVP